MDPELKLALTNMLLPFVYILVAGLVPVAVAWMMNKAAGRPVYNGAKVSKILALLIGAACILTTIQKANMDYPFWQPIVGSVLGYMFWSSRVPLFERSRESWADEQRIYRDRKDKLTY